MMVIVLRLCGALLGRHVCKGGCCCFLPFRCVVMVGLPYPNANDPELKERMAHLDRLASSQQVTLVRANTCSLTPCSSSRGRIWPCGGFGHAEG